MTNPIFWPNKRPWKKYKKLILYKIKTCNDSCPFVLPKTCSGTSPTGIPGTDEPVEFGCSTFEIHESFTIECSTKGTVGPGSKCDMSCKYDRGRNGQKVRLKKL